MTSIPYLGGFADRPARNPDTRSFRVRRWQRHSDRRALELCEYARANGWRELEPSDPEVAERLQGVLELACAVGRRDFGIAYTGPSACGELLLFDSWRSDGSLPPHTLLSLCTDGALAPGVATVDRHGSLDSLGHLPRCLGELPRPARLGFAERHLVLEVPGWLTPVRLGQLAAWATDVDARLPRPRSRV